MSALLTHEGNQTGTSAPVATDERGPLRGAWHRVRLTVQDMNYAARRVVELQAPWTVDRQWQEK